MNKRLVFLAAAIALLAVAAWLMPSVDPSGKPAEPSSGQGTTAAPSFPLGPTPADQAKLQARKTLPPLSAPNAGTPISPSARRDALLAALPSNAQDVIVMEGKSFLDRPVIQRIGDCFAAHGASFPLSSLGLAVADLERVALVDFGEEGSLSVISGNLEKLDVTKLLSNSAETRYGDYGRMFESQLPVAANEGPRWAVARWRDALVLVGKPRAKVEQAIDRLEGRTAGEPLFADSSVYGDAYGRVSPLSLRRGLPPDIVEKAMNAKLVAELHIDAKQDIMIVAEAQGEPAAAQALGKSVAAALAARRVAAASAGDKDMVKLLDLFRVKLGPKGFHLQVGFTEAYLRNTLGSCFTDAQKGAAGSGNKP